MPHAPAAELGRDPLGREEALVYGGVYARMLSSTTPGPAMVRIVAVR
jgi:hypothetical protein